MFFLGVLLLRQAFWVTNAMADGWVTVLQLRATATAPSKALNFSLIFFDVVSLHGLASHVRGTTLGGGDGLDLASAPGDAWCRGGGASSSPACFVFGSQTVRLHGVKEMCAVGGSLVSSTLGGGTSLTRLPAPPPSGPATTGSPKECAQFFSDFL